MVKKISRQEESHLPAFSSHNDAAMYFFNQYKKSFKFIDSELIGGVRCFFYHLVINHEVYERGTDMLSRGSVSGDFGMQFLMSYQPIEIFEDGRVHLVH